jgi:hypothetical protein
VSIVAVCPADIAVGLPVRLTSVDIPAHEVGALAVEMVMHLLNGRHGAQTRLLAPTLTERDSCAAAPRSVAPRDAGPRDAGPRDAGSQAAGASKRSR